MLNSIAFSLRARGHNVFLDRDDLPFGQSYDQQIERAVAKSDAFVFLISPDSIAQGRYTLTELSFARRKWQDPNGHLLPVVVREAPIAQVPPYLKAVTILEPLGNITAETSAAVDGLDRSSHARAVALKFAILGVLSGIVCSFLPFHGVSIFGLKAGLAPDVGVFYGIFLAAGAYFFTAVKRLKRLMFIPFAVTLVILPAMTNQTSWDGPKHYAPSVNVDDLDIDDKTREEIKQRISTTETYAGFYDSIVSYVNVAIAGIFVGVFLIIAIGLVMQVQITRLDILIGLFCGMISGPLFSLILRQSNIFGNSITLMGSAVDSATELTFWSSPGLMLAFAAWQAIVSASVGHWIVRNAS